MRPYWLHVPRGYQPQRQAPLILAFHGGGGSALAMQAQTGLSVLADHRGLLVAYPQGTPQPRGSDHFVWNTSGPADPLAQRVDDGLYVSRVIDAVQAYYCVDRWHLGAVGISNGGGMTGYLACVLAGRIGAFVAVEGEFFVDPAGCHPSHPASILAVHARDDHVAPYAGVPARASPDYYAPAVPTWLGQWAGRDGCAPSARLAHAAGLSVEQWSGCDENVVVVGYLRDRGGHSWPSTIGAASGSDMIVRFILAHPLGKQQSQWEANPPAVRPLVRATPLPVSALKVFRLPGPPTKPFDLAVDHKGAVWFTEFDANRVGRIDTRGHLTQFRVPVPGAKPYQLIARPDGTVIFSEYNTKDLGEVLTSGRVKQVAIAPESLGGLGITQTGLTAWVADPAGSIDRIEPGRLVQRFPVPPAAGTPLALAPGPFGSIWGSPFTGYFEHTPALVSIRPGGPMRLTPLSDPRSDIDALASGPNHTLWFTDYGAGQIGEVTARGTIRRFNEPDAYGGLNDITQGPDKAMWFTEQSGIVGRITASGAIQELALGPPGGEPDGIAAGPRDTIWVAEAGANRIVQILLAGQPTGPT